MSLIASGEVLAGGFSTTYLEAGDPSSPTIVLLHDGAFGTTARLCWEPVIERLADEFHVLAPDLLGWGGTDKVVFLDRSPYAFRIPHVAAFCNELDVESATFIGTSFGGSLLLRAAADPASSWPLSRGVSISGTGGPYRVPEGRTALAAYEPSVDGARALTGLLVADLHGLDDHIEARYRNSLIPGHFEAMQAPALRNPGAERNAPTDPFLDQLRRVTVPMLLVAGNQDPLLEKGWARSLADALPAASVAEIDCAHEPNIDSPDRLLDAILPFLRGE